MNLDSKEKVFSFIKSVVEKMKNDPNFGNIVPKNKGVVVTTEITDLGIVYSENIGFGKYDFVEGKLDNTEVTLTLDFDTYNKMQIGALDPMQCVLNKKLILKGIPFKLLKGKNVNDEFKRLYTLMLNE